MAEHSLVAVAAWVVAHAVVVVQAADVLLLAEQFHLVVADVVLLLQLLQLAVAFVAQHTRLFHVVSTFLTVRKFRFLTLLL